MLKLENLIVGYGEPAAGPFDEDYSDGTCVMLRGANGSGKSTLLKTVAGLLRPVSGSILTGGEVVMVPTHIPKVKGFSVREFIRTSLLARSGIFGRLDARAEKNLEDVIGQLGLDILAGKDISTISDGEFQKACIAAALTRKANVILLDEPTAFLDVDNRIMILRTLRDIAHGNPGAPGPTIIFSTHDIHDGAEYSDTTLSIKQIRP